VIVYVDSSVVLRGYLADEVDHAEVREPLSDSSRTLITGSWTTIEVAGCWHLACARLAFDALAEPGEACGFATHETKQAAVARELGFTTL
jgi:hypothetical protein